MIRLDKYLAHAGYGTRKEVKKLIRKGYVNVNGSMIKSDDWKLDETKDIVCVGEEKVFYQKYYYLMLHKPSGYVSATIDDRYPTVLDLVMEEYAFQLFPVGRLDLDTEGLLLLTNDGTLAHELLSPRKHVDKEYYVELAYPYSEEDIKKLEEGIMINEEEYALPAHVIPKGANCMHLIIKEGKYHQVKRMMHAIQNEVTYLKRVRMGSLWLDETLEKGCYRPLQEKEIKLLKGEL